MKIDLHVHSATGSDGAMSLEEIFAEASRRKIDLLSITDHDAIAHQKQAIELAAKYGIQYVTGVELNVTFLYGGKSLSLDFLGYGYNYRDAALNDRLRQVRRHREARIRQIMDNLNREFKIEGRAPLTDEDMREMESGVDGTLGRPHIADFLIGRGIVADQREAFEKYLVKCDVPKFPLSLAEASSLVRRAGGRLFLAHPNDPRGTSLAVATTEVTEQPMIIWEGMKNIDGIECWHSRHDDATVAYYLEFCREHGLLTSGGSDCHQKPVLMGTVAVPDWVADQFLK